ncbi:hypothetical protein BDZ89DRAFT_1067534 [Hymenopellis radicata]|nr:hypothetical protein BDZ89DRAFT_1067534 [Hymenopellis radicata]
MPWAFFIIGCLILILLATLVGLCCIYIRRDRGPWRRVKSAPQSTTIPDTANRGKGCCHTHKR